MAKSKVPQLRKGLTRDDLLKGTWYAKALARDPEAYKPDPVEMRAIEAALPLLDALLAMVNSGERVSQRTVTSFFTTVERFTQIRDTINAGIKDGRLSPDVLDKLVENI